MRQNLLTDTTHKSANINVRKKDTILTLYSCHWCSKLLKNHKQQLASWSHCTFNALSNSVNGKKIGKKPQYYEASFEVYLDEWVLSWPQQHLSFYTWCPESLSQSFWVNLHQNLVFELDVKHVFHGVEFIQIINLQVGKVGWTNQTIPCFLLSSLTWIQSWIASLYSGWCCIWRYHCQRLNPTKGLMRLFYQTRAISSLALWWLCAF